MAVIASVGSYYLVNRRPDVLLFSNPSFIGTFIQLFVLEYLLKQLWGIVLWPKYFSPLRDLPEPPVF